MFLTTKFLGFGSMQFLAAHTFTQNVIYNHRIMHNVYLFIKSLKVLKESRENVSCRRCTMHPLIPHADKSVTKTVSISMENTKL